MDPALITERDVQHALGGIRSTGLPAESPLVYLNLVAEGLAAAPMASTAEARAWSLAALLAHLVRTQLSQLRGGSQAEVESPTRRAQQTAAVTADFQSGNVDREAWSCLYHRYLSPYPMAVRDLADIAQPGAIHGRRYIARRLDRGYTLLANALRDRERDANERAAAAAPPPSRLSTVARADATPAGRSADEALAALAGAIRGGEAPAELSEADVSAILARSPRDLTEYRIGRIAEWSQPRYRLDGRFVALTLLVDRGEEAASGRWAAKRVRLFLRREGWARGGGHG